MKKEQQKRLCLSGILLAAFVLWTVLIRLIDVQAIGPEGSSVGFATVNRYVQGLTGVHMTLYTVTDWLGLVPFGVVLAFAILGALQWIRRKRILLVDRSILVLGGFYLLVMAAYLFFEVLVINYRPVLINGVLEASYPSSTTMLVTCVMPTAMMQLNTRIARRGIRRLTVLSIAAFTVFMVVGRLLSGVHWVTDIIGGLLLSAGLVLLYRSLAE